MRSWRRLTALAVVSGGAYGGLLTQGQGGLSAGLAIAAVGLAGAALALRQETSSAALPSGLLTTSPRLPAGIRQSSDTLVPRDRSRDMELADLAIEHAQTPIVITDGANRILRFNRACVALSGYTAEELADPACWEKLLLPEEMTAVRHAVDATAAEPFPRVVENVWATRSGQRRLLRWTNSALHGLDGEIRAVVSVATDVTDSRRMEAQFRRIESTLRRAHRIAQLGHWLWSPHAGISQPGSEGDGTYFYSAEAAAIFGVDQDALNLGGDDHYASLLHPDDRQEAMLGYRQFFASPEEHLTQDYRIRRPDGSIRHLRVVSQKVRDPAGAITEITGTIQDLTEIRRAELAIRQIQLILTAAQRLAGVGYWFWEQADGDDADSDGPDTRFHYSAEAQAVSGISEQLMQTLSTEDFCQRFVHEADRARVLEIFMRFARGASDQYTVEYAFHHPYRGDRILRAVALRERNAAGQPLHAIGMIQDITDLRRDEAALRDQQHQLAAAHRLARLGYWSCTGGNDGTPIRKAIWSREAAAITGIDSDMAQAALQADDFEHRFTHPDDRLRVMKAYADLRAQRIKQYDIDYRLRQPGGGEIWLRSLASLRLDAEGRTIGLFGILQDIGDRKRAEAELRLANQSLANAQRIAHVGSWSRDIASGRVVWSDETYRIFGYEPRSLDPSLDLLMASVHRDDRGKLSAAIEASLRNHTDYVIEHRIVRPDGSIRHVREQGEVSLDSDGQVLRLEGVILDITEIKARELALNEARLRAETADRAKTEFLGNMSHELRTPLNAVIGFADVLSQQLFGPIPATYGESIAAISQSGRHLLEIISDLLEMSRIESGERRLAEHSFDPLTAIAECCRMIQAQAEAAGIRLVIDDTGQLPVLLAEERAFKQVLGNLLSNAVKFTPRGGAVAVTVAADVNAGMLVVVSDTGRGIEPSVLPQLGKPFAQGESTLTRRHGGIGLGLAISRRLMELHGGRLEISSQPGQGTRVTMMFPKERLSLP